MAAESRLAIARAVISLEATRGHLKWKISELAKKSGVSRPLVYYHFGRSKRDVLARSLDLFGNELFGLSPERMLLMRRGKAVDSLLASRKLGQADSSFAVFYLRWRAERSIWQRKLIELEKRYQQMLRENFPRMNPEDIEALHGILFAVVAAPFLSDKGTRRLLALAHRIA